MSDKFKEFENEIEEDVKQKDPSPVLIGQEN